MRWSDHTDRTAEAIELLTIIAAEHGVTSDALRSKSKRSRKVSMMLIRREFCERGRALGLSTIELGIAINRDHSTVSYHANPEMRARVRATRPPYISRSERRLRAQQRGEKNVQV